MSSAFVTEEATARANLPGLPDRPISAARNLVTARGLALLDAAAVRGFYREHYLRQATEIGVGGAQDADQVEGLVRRMSAPGEGLLPERSQLAPARAGGRSLGVVGRASRTRWGPVRRSRRCLKAARAWLRLGP